MVQGRTDLNTIPKKEGLYKRKIGKKSWFAWAFAANAADTWFSAAGDWIVWENMSIALGFKIVTTGCNAWEWG